MSTTRLREGGEGGRTHVDPFRAVMHHSLDLVREVPKVGREHRGGDDGAGSRHFCFKRRIWLNAEVVSPFCLLQNGKPTSSSSSPAQYSELISTLRYDAVYSRIRFVRCAVVEE